MGAGRMTAGDASAGLNWGSISGFVAGARAMAHDGLEWSWKTDDRLDLDVDLEGASCSERSMWPERCWGCPT